MPAPFVIWGIVIGATELYALLFVTTATVAYVTYETTPPIRWSTPSWDRTWEETPVMPITAPPVAIPITDTKTKPKAIPRREQDIYNVYDLHFIQPSQARYYTFGEGYEVRNKIYKIGDIYKYGLTSMPTTYLRYLVWSRRTGSDKEEYILDLLTRKILSPKEWYLKKRTTYVKANNKEVDLIKRYETKHGELPPANTFYG